QTSVGGQANGYGLSSYGRVVGYGVDDAVRLDSSYAAIQDIRDVEGSVGRYGQSECVQRRLCRGPAVTAESDPPTPRYGADNAVGAVSGNDPLRSIRRNTHDQITVRKRDELRTVRTDFHVEQDALTDEIGEGDGSCQRSCASARAISEMHHACIRIVDVVNIE